MAEFSKFNLNLLLLFSTRETIHCSHLICPTTRCRASGAGGGVQAQRHKNYLCRLGGRAERSGSVKGKAVIHSWKRQQCFACETSPGAPIGCEGVVVVVASFSTHPSIQDSSLSSLFPGSRRRRRRPKTRQVAMLWQSID